MRVVQLAAVLLCPGIASAASFERFDAPGATTTCGISIASNGLVSGYAYVGTIVVGDAAMSKAPALGSFLYRSGHFTQPVPTVPASTFEFAGVNKAGAIAGIYFDKASLTTQSFLYAHHATTLLTIPNATSITVAGITDSGTLFGSAGNAGGPLHTGSLGFLKTALGITFIDDGSNATSPAGVDQTNTYVVGTSFSESNPSWIYHAGSFKPISFPGAIFTSPRSVTSKLLVSGNYILQNATGALTVHGFRYKDGLYKTFDLPGADATTIGGMNEAGQITGCFTKGARTHGFLYTP